MCGCLLIDTFHHATAPGAFYRFSNGELILTHGWQCGL
jgi:hypothetical protein